MKKPVAALLAVALISFAVPVADLAAGAARGSGTLVGHIYDEDMRTPVPDVVVVLRNLATQEEYWSEPTGTDGMYTIPDVEEGRYIMGVRSRSGSYNFHYSVMIRSDALAKLSVAMKPGGDPVKLEEGTALQKKKGILEFFKSPAGVLALVSAVEMTLFAVALSEGEASEVDF